MGRGGEGSTPIDSAIGSPAGVGNTSVLCCSYSANFTFFTTTTGTGCRFSILCGSAANSLSVGELSMYSSKTQDSSKIISFEMRLPPYVPLSNHGVTMYVGTSTVVYEYARNRQRRARR